MVWTELGYADAEVWYVRGLDGSDTQIARPARNFMARIGVPLVQVVDRPGILRVEPDALVTSAERLLAVIP
jgi:hypothetical protein